jgi:hypothetical protein
MYDWSSDITSPRSFTATNIQPYMTWATPQNIASVRVWADVDSKKFDRLIIETLNPGGNPAVDGDWTVRVDTGTGINADFRDIYLGGTFSTTGLRVRAFSAAADINVGEVAVFGPLGIDRTSTLTDLRVLPTAWAASSTNGANAASRATDGLWTKSPGGHWLSDTSANNPGSDFILDMTMPNAIVTALSVTFAGVSGLSNVPSSWEIFYDTGGGLTSLGTFTRVGTRDQYYIDLGMTLIGVRSFRVRVPESAVVQGVSIMEFEAFNLTVPEPAAVGALLPLLLLRRRRA